jgi:hypothetical protein
MKRNMETLTHNPFKQMGKLFEDLKKTAKENDVSIVIRLAPENVVDPTRPYREIRAEGTSQPVEAPSVNGL